MMQNRLRGIDAEYEGDPEHYGIDWVELDDESLQQSFVERQASQQEATLEGGGVIPEEAVGLANPLRWSVVVVDAPHCPQGNWKV
jgi:hypothetical protein